MHVKRFADAKPYEAPNHRAYSSLRLFGADAGGTKGGRIDQAHHTMTLRCQRNSTRAFDVNGPIGLVGRLSKNAHEIGDCISSRDGSADSDVVKQIGLDIFHCLVGLGRNLT